MTRDDIIRMAREAGLAGVTVWDDEEQADVLSPNIEEFANIISKYVLSKSYPEIVSITTKHAIETVVAAEREKVAKWMMQHSYATGHGETIEDLLAELDWQITENWNRAMINGINTEREACAKVCEEAHWSLDDRNEYAAAIRARGQK